MRLVKAERNELEKGYKRTALLVLLDEFMAGGYDCAKVEGAADHYCSLSSGQSSINKAIKRFKFVGIKAIMRKNEIYIIKIDAEK